MSKIICQRTFTYDVKEVKDSIRELNNNPKMKVSDEEVWELVYGWAQEDMRSAPSRHDLTFVNEDGEEIG
jgi:hypothetical protein